MRLKEFLRTRSAYTATNVVMVSRFYVQLDLICKPLPTYQYLFHLRGQQEKILREPSKTCSEIGITLQEQSK
jgi:hypothetical protein